jgi:two-component system nitrogen regulation response regulator NtrX
VGQFRQDLFFRLNVIPIHSPPLREIKEDIPHLLYHFLKVLKKEITLEGDALELLAAHDWPGNIRELKNLAERMAVMHQGNVINGEELGKLLNIRGKKPVNTGQTGMEPTIASNILEQNYNEAKDNFEKYYLEFQLLKNNGIISRTAEAIGIYPSNLHAKIRKYGITTAKNREQ